MEHVCQSPGMCCLSKLSASLAAPGHIKSAMTLIWLRVGRHALDDQVLTMLRGQLTQIISGAVFAFGGLAACAIAVVRRRSGVRLMVWLGTWSAIYGVGLLTRSPAVVAALPHSLRVSVPYVNTVTAYVTVVVAFLAFLELT